MPDRIPKTVVVEVTEDKPYNRCIKCDRLGVRCDGPNFAAMTPDRIVEWIRIRKEWLGWTNSMLADHSGTPKGTIDRILAGGHADFKMGTIAPIIKALVGGSWGQFPCPDPETAPQDLKTLLDALAVKDGAIESLRGAASATEEKHAKELSRIEGKHEREEKYLMDLVDDLRAQVADYKQLIRKVIAITATLALVIIIALVIDRSDPSIGFIWRGTT